MTSPADQPWPEGHNDRAALDELCQRHYPAVHDRVHRLLARDIRRGRGWLSSVLSTGDLVHEVFLGVVRDFDGFRGSSDQQFVAYLARLVRNRLVDTVRFHEAAQRDGRRKADISTDGPSSAPSPQAVLIQREDVQLVQEILDSFPDRDRALLRGRIEDGEPFGRLAHALGYASADSARKMFRSIQARLLARLELRRGAQS
ncbi:MAG: RNA polymerase sigma factor [Planctomycetota bacterium]